MLEQIQTEFELMGLTIAQLPEQIGTSMQNAVLVLTHTLTEGHKILLMHDRTTSVGASLFEKELLQSSNMERPPLPCLRLEHGSLSDAALCQLEATANPGDAFLLFRSAPEFQYGPSATEIPAVERSTRELLSEQSEEKYLESAKRNNLARVILGNRELNRFEDVDEVQLIMSTNSYAAYTCANSFTAMVLARLIEQQLFNPID